MRGLAGTHRWVLLSFRTVVDRDMLVVRDEVREQSVVGLVVTTATVPQIMSEDERVAPYSRKIRTYGESDIGRDEYVREYLCIVIVLLYFIRSYD